MMAADLSQPNKLQASAIEIVALALIIVLVGWFFVKPVAATLKTQRAELQRTQAQYEQVKQDESSLGQLSAKLDKSRDDIALADEALPLEDRPTQLEVLLDSLVSASGMRAVNLGFQPAEDSVAAGNKAVLKDRYGVARKLATTNVDLSVTGSIDQFKNLLELMETNGRILDITSLDMTNDQGTASFKLKLKAYSYVP